VAASDVRLTATLTALSGLLLALGLLAPARASQSSDAPFVPGEVLVKFKTGASAAAIEALNAAAGAHTIRVFPRTGVHHLRTALPVEDAVKIYQASADVEYAEPNYIVDDTGGASAHPR
jgi:hypothetical protein